MQVAIVKYNAGNIYSVDCALRRVGITPILTDDKEALMAADKVIFPGVGEAATTMTYLRHIRCRRKTFSPRESGTESAAYGLEYGNRY